MLYHLFIALLAGIMLAGCQGGSSGADKAGSRNATAEAGAMAPVPYAIFNNSVLSEVIKRNKLTVGMEVKYWPFEYADEKGNPVGFDVDLARMIAKEMEVELEIKDMEWSGLIPALQTGKVDMVISGMTATLTRAKTVSFTQPYFVTGLCALLNKSRAGDISDIKELNAEGRIIAVKTGTTGDLVARKKFPRAQINRFKDETACAAEVANARADAFFYDQISIAKHQKQNPDTTFAILEPFTYEPFAIAIRKGDADFLNWLNMFLSVIDEDERLEELRQKYFTGLFPRQRP